NRETVKSDCNQNNNDKETATQTTSEKVVINDETKTVEVVPETQGNQVTSDSLADAVLAKVKAGTSELDLANAYVKSEVTSDSEAIQTAKAELEGILSASIGIQ